MLKLRDGRFCLMIILEILRSLLYSSQNGDSAAGASAMISSRWDGELVCCGCRRDAPTVSDFGLGSQSSVRCTGTPAPCHALNWILRMVKTLKASTECLCVAQDEPLDGRRAAIVKGEKSRDSYATLEAIRVTVSWFAADTRGL